MADKTISIEELAKRFHEAIPEVIKENLKAGVPVYYEDESGHWVKECPDGTIDVIEEAEISDYTPLVGYNNAGK